MPSPTDLALTRPATTGKPTEQGPDLFLVVALGARRFVLPAAVVIRVLPMAAPISLPDAPPDVVGALPFRGALLPVVDPRPRLGQPRVAMQPKQHLIALARYLLWVDRAETVAAAPVVVRADLAGERSDLLAPQLVRLGDDFLPVLAADAFAPAALLPVPDLRPR